jgi:NAD(P)-dependent dehydrogenase (short-subunit alcohol dehydrogenase family)
VRQAALELARHGILVNASPRPDDHKHRRCRLLDAAARAPFERAIPMHRLATPADLRGCGALLASPASAYITGTQIVVDGGSCLGPTD